MNMKHNRFKKMLMSIFFSFFKIATSCGPNQFECKTGICKYTDNDNCYGSCIKSDWVQDNESDCTDGSDEGKYLHCNEPLL